MKIMKARITTYLLFMLVSLMWPIDTHSQVILDADPNRVGGSVEETGKLTSRSQLWAPWGFYTNNPKTSSEDLWITRIAFLSHRKVLTGKFM